MYVKSSIEQDAVMARCSTGLEKMSSAVDSLSLKLG